MLMVPGRGWYDQRMASAGEPEASALHELESWLEALLTEREAREPADQ